MCNGLEPTLHSTDHELRQGVLGHPAKLGIADSRVDACFLGDSCSSRHESILGELVNDQSAQVALREGRFEGGETFLFFLDWWRVGWRD